MLAAAQGMGGGGGGGPQQESVVMPRRSSEPSRRARNTTGHGRQRSNTSASARRANGRRIVIRPQHVLNFPGTDTNVLDNAETVYISSLALLKMLRHGRAGVPMEVMGLMLGEFVDDYTVRVVDVFAMPQSGTGVSVEAVDPVFQTKMMDMLRQTGRPETVVGWYHSHPGFGCWLSSVDINTQQSFEQLTPRAVAVVVDPIQSVKGKVVIDAFRLINPQTLMLGQEPRQTTSNVGHLNKPSIQALIHGLNRHYYSIGIGYRKSALEEGMLMNLHKTVWTEALTMPDFATEGTKNQASLEKLVSLAEGYEKRVREEGELTKDQLRTRYVGKVDPKKHIEQVGQDLIEDNIVAVSRQMIDKEASVPSHYEGGGNGGKGAGGGVSVENAMSILNKRQASGGGHSHGKMEVDGDAEEDL
ncbi:26S proteasome regulatory subunit [Hortaea werneckii]|nr:26S proteasome regulatory subunit [Hortaea werneckii]KAI7096445.1 26S proteasome regulatory subunit [Hortaea werneckii]KAI7208726.1 26S proteasome regulatory subunit [Hortaea werneckii]KAI7291995.1 26S proteasome regulatory subunit [Hortaea werneckii]KAI7376933.1 26S proteasome regulatory subunit [Hortaea werneckii]